MANSILKIELLKFDIFSIIVCFFKCNRASLYLARPDFLMAGKDELGEKNIFKHVILMAKHNLLFEILNKK